MKNIVAEAGGRPYYNADFIEMQNLSLAFEKMLGGYAAANSFNFVKLSGFGHDEEDVFPGLALVLIDGVYKIATFEGYKVYPNMTNIYFSVEKITINQPYKDAVVRTSAFDYIINASHLDDTGSIFDWQVWDRLPTLSDLIQDDDHRMVSVADILNWSNKANTGHGHSASEISETGTRTFTTPTERTTWNGARSGAVSDIRDSIATAYNTLNKLYNWVVSQLAGKSNTGHGHSASEISETGTRTFTTPTERTTWNGARSGAVSDIRDSIATAYNTLNKLYVFVNQQLNTKATISDCENWDVLDPVGALYNFLHLYYRKDAFGYVHLLGQVTGGSLASIDNCGYILPPNCCPASTIEFQLIGERSPALVIPLYLRIDSLGRINTCHGTNGTWYPTGESGKLNVNGISFKAA